MTSKQKIDRAAPPMLILCVGLKSSGSTWLYNAVIQLLEAALRRRGTRIAKDAVMAFYADNFAMFPDGAERARFLVVKSHLPSAELLLLARMTRGRIFITLREPRDAVASLLQRFRHPFASALKDVSAGARHISDMARRRDASIFRYEDGFYDDPATLRQVAEVLGVRVPAAARLRIHRALTSEAVREKIGKLRRKGVLADHPDAFDSRTHWHPGHVGDGTIGKFASILSSAQRAEVLAATAAYRRQFGYAAAGKSAKRHKR